MRRWFNERKYYSFGKFAYPMPQSMCTKEPCGHYTQVLLDRPILVNSSASWTLKTSISFRSKWPVLPWSGRPVLKFGKHPQTCRNHAGANPENYNQPILFILVHFCRTWKILLVKKQVLKHFSLVCLVLSSEDKMISSRFSQFEHGCKALSQY